jgi:hypothetical protein
MSTSYRDPVMSRVKEYITPGLITILGVMLWAEISELKRDVKTLLANDAASKMKVDMLEKEIDRIRENISYNDTKPLAYTTIPKGSFYRAVAKKEDEPEVPKNEDNEA